ncbi:hypothetical protein [Actinomadura macra]|uniref:hypothetical protein n=1 Tax=Actinomadura macra TaxID=46164 RepID=UPI00082A9B8B|nr:hypothetical protein [Actinomadura macra]
MTLTTPAPAPVPSSSHHRRGCGDAAPAIRQHWGTPVAFATLDPAGLLTPSAARISAEGPAMETVPPGEMIADLDAVAAQFHLSFDELVAAHHPDLAPPISGVAIEVHIWRHGHHLPPAAHPADLIAWWVLHSAPTPAPSDSGAIALADPRTGSPFAPLPGRPWGRHLLIRPIPGAHVAVPGWLTTSVTPLAPGQHVLVAVASTIR